MGTSIAKFGGKVDPLTGAANLGSGVTRPPLTDLIIDLKGVGGLSTKIQGKNNLKIKSSPERQALIDSVSNLLKEGAGELEGIREQVKPGFSAFREAGLNAIGTRARQSIGNLRENLARRRVLGSSFAGDAIQRAEREFAQEEAEFASATTLQELDAFTQLTQQITNQQIAAVETQINELNLQLDVGLALSGQAAQSITAASIQQQQNAAAFTSNLMSLGAAGAGACAIAREVYGIESPRWVLFRDWLFSDAPRWLNRWYIRHQYRVAAWLRDKPRAKRMVRFFMDWIIDG